MLGQMFLLVLLIQRKWILIVTEYLSQYTGTCLNGFPIRGRKDYPVLFDRKNNSKSVVDDMIIIANKYKSKK